MTLICGDRLLVPACLYVTFIVADTLHLTVTIGSRYIVIHFTVYTMMSSSFMSVQHVLTVFRTQRISRLTLHLESDANTLLLVVHADNGEPTSPASHNRQA